MILYFGNILSSTGNNPSFIELLVPKLQTIYSVISASHKKNKVLRLLNMIAVLLSNMAKTKVVLIDTYSYQGYYFAWVIGVICRYFKKPYVPIIRGGDFMNRMHQSPELTYSFLKHAGCVVAPSEYLYEALREKGIDVILIPNFIEINDYIFKPRSYVSLRLLWVRSFHKIYDPELAIEAVALLKNKFPSIQLTMVGPEKDGSLARCRELIIKCGLQRNITITGKLSKQEIRSISIDHDIFINTTTVDNHPVSVMEAMALGLIVISTNVGGTPYLVTHNENGLLVPIGDTARFAIAIETILFSPHLVQRFQDNARSKVEHYDWSVVKDHWMNLLNPYLAR